MIKIDPAILIVMGEIILLLVVAVMGGLFYIVKGKRRDRAAVSELQERLKDNTSKRQEWFESILTNGIENGDEQANRELAMNWVKKENNLYTHLVDMYVKRNSSALRGLDKLLHEYTSSYLELVSMMRTRVDEVKRGGPDDLAPQLERMAQDGERLSAMIKTLEQENERLSGELGAAKRDVDQAMREYATTFRTGGGVTGVSVKGNSTSKTVAAAPLAMNVEMNEIPEPEIEIAAGSSSRDWRISFDEYPDFDLGIEENSGAEKERAIKLDEERPFLPELNESLVSDEFSRIAVDYTAIDDVVPDDQLPILDEHIASDFSGQIDEVNLLAPLEALEEIELPSFSSEIDRDEPLNQRDKMPAPQF